jgi:hypothetical protein
MNLKQRDKGLWFDSHRVHVSVTHSVVYSFQTGLYYDSFQNDIGAERAFLEANRANAASMPKKPMPVALAEELSTVERKGSGM